MGQLPDIPEYYSKYINSKVDLRNSRSVPCDIHKEQEGKSFSYNPDTGKCGCFGKCKFYGDVITLHQHNFKLSSREEAEASLRSMYKAAKGIVDLKAAKPKVNENTVRYHIAYNRALVKATTPDEWVMLDYIMSQYPPDVDKLEVFANGAYKLQHSKGNMDIEQS